MPNASFQFRRFVVMHDQCAQKVGTDSILLGSWASATTAGRILDVGTGCGILSLMMAQRTEGKTVRILGVEIDAKASQQAAENVTASPWHDRISIQNAEFGQFATEVADGQFELVISNPPFFRSGEGSPKHARNAARHAESLPLDAIVTQSQRMLTATGRLAMILPVESGQAAIQFASSAGMHLRRRTNVRPTPDAPPKRALLEFSNSPGGLEEKELIVELSRHEYSDDFQRFTEAYYLPKTFGKPAVPLRGTAKSLNPPD
ncbi:MAG: methyltransferase, partial [Planctomycetota bacterium]